MTVSVIIPLYNNASLLPRCVESLYRQGIDESSFEVIIVNDGSTDGGGKIADQLAETHPNIHVIHQENKGISLSRNLGMELARGEYLHFVDADDFVLDGTYSYFTKQLVLLQPDIVAFDFVKDGEENQMHSLGNEIFYSQIDDYILNHGIRSYVWTKLIKRNFLCSNNIYFVPNLYSEDVLFSWDMLCRGGSVLYSTAKAYSYTSNTNGAVRNRNVPFLKWTIESYLTINESLKLYSEKYAEYPLVLENFEHKYRIMFNRILCTIYSYREIRSIFKRCAAIGVSHLPKSKELERFDWYYNHPLFYFIFHWLIVRRYFQTTWLNPDDGDFITWPEAQSIRLKYNHQR